MPAEVERFVSPLVAIFIGIALIPAVQMFIESANLTGSVATLIGLIPFFYGLAVFLYSVKAVTV
jgi:hypothetical protein